MLDGEIVAFDDEGRPRFSASSTACTSPDVAKRLAARGAKPTRRASSSSTSCTSTGLAARPPLRRAPGRSSRVWGSPARAGRSTPSFTDARASDVLATAVELGMEGVVAKRRSASTGPGVRSRDWMKVKDVRTQEVVIGGWTTAKGERTGTFGALLLGIPPTPGD